MIDFLSNSSTWACTRMTHSAHRQAVEIKADGLARFKGHYLCNDNTVKYYINGANLEQIFTFPTIFMVQCMNHQLVNKCGKCDSSIKIEQFQITNGVPIYYISSSHYSMYLRMIQSLNSVMTHEMIEKLFEFNLNRRPEVPFHSSK